MPLSRFMDTTSYKLLRAISPNLHLRAVEDKDDVIGFWGQNVKGQGHARRDQIWLKITCSKMYFSGVPVGGIGLQRPSSLYVVPVGCETRFSVIWMDIKHRPRPIVDYEFCRLDVGHGPVPVASARAATDRHSGAFGHVTKLAKPTCQLSLSLFVTLTTECQTRTVSVTCVAKTYHTKTYIGSARTCRNQHGNKVRRRLASDIGQEVDIDTRRRRDKPSAMDDQEHGILFARRSVCHIPYIQWPSCVVRRDLVMFHYGNTA